MATGSLTFTGNIRYANRASALTASGGAKIPSGATITSVTATLNGAPNGSRTISLYKTNHAVASNKIGQFSVTTSSYTGASVSNVHWDYLIGASTIYAVLTQAISTQRSCQIIVNYTAAEEVITWDSSASLSVKQTGNGSISAFLFGSATDSYGKTLSYYLYDGSTSLGTITPSKYSYFSNRLLGSHTFKVVASSGTKTSDGPSTTIEIVEPTLVWNNPTLTVEQTNLYTKELLFTWGGEVVCNLSGVSEYYEIFEDGSTTSLSIRQGPNNTATLFYPQLETPGEHTYTIKAIAAGVTAEGAACTFTVVAKSATAKYFDGEELIECEVYRYVNGEFVKIIPYYYDGSNWILCSHS